MTKVTVARKSASVMPEPSEIHKRTANEKAKSGIAKRSKPIPAKRAFEHVCDQIRHEVALGTLRTGDKLLAERELSVKYGVSRTAVREALRNLEVFGIVGLKQGVKGGAFILRGDPDLIANSLRDMLHLGRISLSHLTEARTLVMQMAVGLAAERIRPTTIAALDRNVSRLSELPKTDHIPERAALSAEFYGLIAQATDNTVLQVIVEALSDTVLKRLAFQRSRMLPELIAHRQRLVRLLAAHQKNDAQQEITEHLLRLHEHLEREERSVNRHRSSD